MRAVFSSSDNESDFDTTTMTNTTCESSPLLITTNKMLPHYLQNRTTTIAPQTPQAQRKTQAYSQSYRNDLSPLPQPSPTIIMGHHPLSNTTIHNLLHPPSPFNTSISPIHTNTQHIHRHTHNKHHHSPVHSHHTLTPIHTPPCSPSIHPHSPTPLSIQLSLSPIYPNYPNQFYMNDTFIQNHDATFTHPLTITNMNDTYRFNIFYNPLHTTKYPTQ